MQSHKINITTQHNAPGSVSIITSGARLWCIEIILPHPGCFFPGGEPSTVARARIK